MTRHLLWYSAAIPMGVLCFAGAPAQSESGAHTVASPDGRMVVTIASGEELAYSVACAGRQILWPSPISMTLDSGLVLGRPAEVVGSTTRSADQVPHPAVRHKHAEIRDHYDERCIKIHPAPGGGWAALITPR